MKQSKHKLTLLLTFLLLFIIVDVSKSQSLNSILSIKYKSMDGPNTATIRITVPLGDGWYDAKIIVKDRGVEQVVWQRSLMEESETITVDYQVTNLEIDSLVEISAWAEFKLPEGRQGPLRKSDKRYLLSKGDEILQSFDESYINYFDLEYEKKKLGYENYTQEQLEYYDPDFAERYLKKWPKRLDKVEPYRERWITKRDSTLKVRERIILGYSKEKNKQMELSLYDNENNLIDEARYYVYYLENETKVKIYKRYSFNLKPEEVIILESELLPIDEGVLELLNYKSQYEENIVDIAKEISRGDK